MRNVSSLTRPAPSRVLDAERHARRRVEAHDRALVPARDDERGRRDERGPNRAAGRRDFEVVEHAVAGHGVAERLGDRDHRLASALVERGIAARRCRVGHELLGIHVGHVHRVDRGAPRDVAILPDDDERNACEPAAHGIEFTGRQVDRVERRRRAERQVRIVGEQGFAARGVAPGDRPLVRAWAIAAVEVLAEHRVGLRALEGTRAPAGGRWDRRPRFPWPRTLGAGLAWRLGRKRRRRGSVGHRRRGVERLRAPQIREKSAAPFAWPSTAWYVSSACV